MRHSRGRDEAFIAELLAGRTIPQAGAGARVSRATAYRLYADPAFQEKYRQAKEELSSGIVGVLHSSALAFITTLRDIAADPKAHPQARATAAREGLSAYFKAKELDLTSRIEALERRAASDQSESR